MGHIQVDKNGYQLTEKEAPRTMLRQISKEEMEVKWALMSRRS